MARHISPTSAWDSLTREYAQFRTLREKSEDREAALKKDILGHLSTRGEADPAGHRTIATERLRVGKKTIVGLRRQRRTSQVLDVAAATAWLKQNGLLDKCMVTETHTHFSEDNLIGLNFAGTIPDHVFKGFYSEKESFALTLVEADDDDEDEGDE